jgi:hypothetical protein
MAGDGIKTHRVMRENSMRLLRGQGGEEKQSSFAFVLARGFVTATTRDAMHRSSGIIDIAVADQVGGGAGGMRPV